MERRGLLKLQHCAQAFIHRPLQPRRQSSGRFRKEPTIQSQQLRDVHNRIAVQARRARWQQYIARGLGKVQVCRDYGSDGGLNPAEIEGIGLDHQTGRR